MAEHLLANNGGVGHILGQYNNARDLGERLTIMNSWMAPYMMNSGQNSRFIDNGYYDQKFRFYNSDPFHNY